jgi:hypothetical protein
MDLVMRKSVKIDVELESGLKCGVFDSNNEGRTPVRDPLNLYSVIGCPGSEPQRGSTLRPFG